MSNYDQLYGRVTRGILFFFALGLTGYEAVFEHSHNKLVYLVAVALGGGPFADVVQALFTGKIQIQIVKDKTGNGKDRGA